MPHSIKTSTTSYNRYLCTGKHVFIATNTTNTRGRPGAAALHPPSPPPSLGNAAYQLEHEVSRPKLGELAHERAPFDPEGRPREHRLQSLKNEPRKGEERRGQDSGVGEWGGFDWRVWRKDRD